MWKTHPYTWKNNIVFVKFHLKKYWNKLKGNKVHTSVNRGLISQAAIVSQRRGRALAKGKEVGGGSRQKHLPVAPKGAEMLLAISAGGKEGTALGTPCRDVEGPVPWGMSRGKGQGHVWGWIFPLREYFCPHPPSNISPFHLQCWEGVKDTAKLAERKPPPGLMLMLFDLAAWVGARESFDLWR